MATAAAGTAGRSFGNIRSIIAKQGIFVAFALFLIAFGLVNDRFLSFDNIGTVVRQSAIIGIIALGVTVKVRSLTHAESRLFALREAAISDYKQKKGA